MKNVIVINSLKSMFYKVVKLNIEEGDNINIGIIDADLSGYDRNKKYDNEFWRQDLIDTFERIKILMQYGCLPYIMRFNRYEESPYRGTYINLARWCNQPNFYKKMSYSEFCEANQLRIKTKTCSAMKYLNEVKKDFPDIANTYFDIKYENVIQRDK